MTRQDMLEIAARNGAVEVTTSVKFRQWNVPNYATVEMPPSKREEGLREAPSYHVRELGDEALIALAAAWLAKLFENAGRDKTFQLQISRKARAHTKGASILTPRGGRE